MRAASNLHAQQGKRHDTDIPAVIPAGPAVRRIARQRNIDLSLIEGSGARGRITIGDVESAAANASLRHHRPAPVRRIVTTETDAPASAVSLATIFDDADVTDLEHLRKGIPAGYLGPNVTLSIIPFAMKAVAIALDRYPTLNVRLHEVCNVEHLSVSDIAKSLSEPSNKIDASPCIKSAPSSKRIVIRDTSAFGGTYSTPAVNDAEAATLSIGRARLMTIVRNEKSETRLMLPLSFSYDSRIVDEVTAGRFFNEVIGYLESPGRLLID